MAKKTGVALKPNTYEDWLRQINLVKRFLPPTPNQSQTKPPEIEPRLWLQASADSASVGDIPPYAVVQPTGGASSNFAGAVVPIIGVQKPDTDNLTTCALVDDRGIPLENPVTHQSGIGRMTFEPFWALYDTSGSDPVMGAILGTVANQFYLRTGGTGYLSLGAFYAGRVLVKPVQSTTPILLRVELSEALSQGGSADATIVEWNGSAWVATGGTVTIYDSLNRFSGTTGDRYWVVLGADSARWEIVSPATGGSSNEPILFELTETFEQGQVDGGGVPLPADAVTVEWDGTDSWDATATTIQVVDPLGRYSGVTGDRGWAILNDVTGYHEIVTRKQLPYAHSNPATWQSLSGGGANLNIGSGSHFGISTTSNRLEITTQGGPGKYSFLAVFSVRRDSPGSAHDIWNFYWTKNSTTSSGNLLNANDIQSNSIDYNDEVHEIVVCLGTDTAAVGDLYRLWGQNMTTGARNCEYRGVMVKAQKDGD